MCILSRVIEIHQKPSKKSKLAKSTEFIEPNYIYTALEVPNDPDYSKQWNMRSINVESAWDETKAVALPLP